MRALFLFSGLLLSFSTYATEIPVPPEIRDPGGIKVTGPTWPAQTQDKDKNNNWFVCNVARDKSGQMKRDGANTCTWHKVDEEIHLPAGTYIVGFSGTRAFVEVQSAVVPLPLLPLSVDKVDGTYEFKLRIDMQVVEEQSKLLDYAWIGDFTYLLVNTVECDPQYKSSQVLDPAATNLCAQVKNAKSPSDLKSIYKFEADGLVTVKHIVETGKYSGERSIYTANFESGPNRHSEVINGKDGDTVWMFPGTYAAIWTSSGGHVTHQANIVVKDAQARLQMR